MSAQHDALVAAPAQAAAVDKIRAALKGRSTAAVDELQTRARSLVLQMQHLLSVLRGSLSTTDLFKTHRAFQALRVLAALRQAPANAAVWDLNSACPQSCFKLAVPAFSRSRGSPLLHIASAPLHIPTTRQQVQ